MLISAFPRVVRFVIYGLMHLCSAAIAFYLSYAAYTQFGVSLKTGTVTTVLLIPLYPFYLFESICVLVFAVAVLWHAFTSFAAIGNEELAAEIQSTWS